VKQEVIRCDRCNGKVRYIKEGEFCRWWCDNCKRTVIGKSTLLEVNYDKKGKEL